MVEDTEFDDKEEWLVIRRPNGEVVILDKRYQFAEDEELPWFMHKD